MVQLAHKGGEMTRQTAIKLVGAVIGAFIGKRIYSQTKKSELEFITKPGVTLDLDGLAFVKVKYGGEEIEIARGELFNALKAK